MIFRSSIVNILVCLISIFSFHTAFGQDISTEILSATPTKIRVATKTIEPFVMAKSDTGFTIDLLNTLSQRIGIPYELHRYSSVEELLKATESNTVDLSLAAITINSTREKRVDFSQPMFTSGLQIVVPFSDSESRFKISMLFPLLKVIGVLMILMLISGYFVWLFEHKTNPDFSDHYLEGIWDGFWWAAVTVTTVGYGDKAPKKIFGKCMGLIWMFTSMFVIAYFTSSITSTLTVQTLQESINKPSDLIGKKVATIENTAPEKYIRETLKINPITFPDLPSAYEAVTNKEVDAMIYDAPVLQYYAAHEGYGNIKTVGQPFNREFYGIAFPKNSPLRNTINIALLSLLEDGTYQSLQEKWFETEK